MSEEITEFTPFELSDGRTVIELCGDFYRVQAPDGTVTGCQARTEATEASAEADIITDPPPVRQSVPTEVGPAQLRIAMRRLHEIGTDEIQGFIDQIGDPEDKQDALDLWDYATAIKRTHPLVTAMATAFGLTSDDIDATFILAATI